MLLCFLTLPLIGFFICCFFSASYHIFLRIFSLIWFCFTLIVSISLGIFLKPSATNFFIIQDLSILASIFDGIIIGLDGFSWVLLILTSFLFVLCSLLSWNQIYFYYTKSYLMILFLVEFFLFFTFSSLNLILFYIFFESVLIPMYLLIGFYGSRSRSVKASYLLFLYTLLSSVFMLLSIIYIFIIVGSTDYLFLKSIKLEPFYEKLCWLAFFLSFAVKTPLVPFHIWLPEAHCEAPTSGSVILAGILLKLGSFGFLRFSIGLFPESSAFFTPLIFVFCIFSVIYASFTTLQQVDLKKIVAYSSISHMGLVTIGLFSGNSQGILGAIFLTIGHGVVSSGLFICIGFLYERYHTRIVRYYSGLVNTMPIFSTFFTILILANIGLPGSCNFIGEVLILVGCLQVNCWTTLLSGTGMIFGAGFCLWLHNRILFGNINENSIFFYKDIRRLEFWIILPIIILTGFFGFFPNILIDFIYLY